MASASPGGSPRGDAGPTFPRVACSAFGIGLLFATGVVFGLASPDQAAAPVEEVVQDTGAMLPSVLSQAREIAAMYGNATYDREVYSPPQDVISNRESPPTALRLLAVTSELSPTKTRVKTPPNGPAVRLPASYRTSVPKAPTSTLSQRVLKIIQLYAPKHGDPKALAERIVRESVRQEYDPLFVAAVIKSESGFNSLARSHVGARGLMQIMPATGAYMADKLNIQKLQLYDSDQNLKLGIAFLKELEASYGGDKVMTLVAYNWGPGHVELAGKGKRRIPGDVMRYAVKILNDYRRWRGEPSPHSALG